MKTALWILLIAFGLFVLYKLAPLLAIPLACLLLLGALALPALVGCGAALVGLLLALLAVLLAVLLVLSPLWVPILAVVGVVLLVRKCTRAKTA